MSPKKIKWFETYSVLACAFFISPLIILARSIRNEHQFLFHVLLFMAGWLAWTWTEYHVHRFLMHPKSDKWKTNTSRTHQHHHKEPSKLEVTLLHRILLFIFSCLFCYISYRCNNYFTLFAGFFWGAAFFCYIHYLLHHKWTKPFLPVHHRFHIYHHCRYTDRCYGVSVPWWDYLFFTAPPRHAVISDRVIDFYYAHKSTD
jgi:hypothetical protein